MLLRQLQQKHFTAPYDQQTTLNMTLEAKLLPPELENVSLPA
jgi:hypothetical protein